MKPFRYEPKGLWVNAVDISLFRLYSNADAKRADDFACWQALEMMRATCISKGYKYRLMPLVPAIYVSKDVAAYLDYITPPAWKRLDIIVTI